jgi:aminoglycoside 6'-N-acetyltransferase
MIILRVATISDLQLLRGWDNQKHVIDSDPAEDDWDWEKELQRFPDWREQLIAELDTKPIGVIQIIDPALEESHYWGAIAPGRRAIDIWIGEEAHLNKGHGTEMMRLAIERCFADPTVESILVDPLKTNTKAHRFYRRLSFKFVEERHFDGSVCYVFELKRGATTSSTFAGQ